MSRLLVLLSATLLLVACTTSVAPSPSPTPAPPQSATAGVPSPAATLLPFPAASEVELVPGRYDSAPPFDIEFTFQIFEMGWHTAHINGEFFDIMRFDGPDPRNPTLWLAWAHPTTIHGERDHPAADLAPQEAATVMASRPGIEPGPGRPFTLAGLDGVQLDLHSEIGQVPLFGGPAGDFRLDNTHDLRMGIVKLDGEMLLVMCLAAPAELDAACEEVQPILDSVDL